MDSDPQLRELLKSLSLNPKVSVASSLCRLMSLSSNAQLKSVAVIQRTAQVFVAAAFQTRLLLRQTQLAARSQACRCLCEAATEMRLGGDLPLFVGAFVCVGFYLSRSASAPLSPHTEAYPRTPHPKPYACALECEYAFEQKGAWSSLKKERDQENS